MKKLLLTFLIISAGTCFAAETQPLLSKEARQPIYTFDRLNRLWVTQITANLSGKRIISNDPKIQKILRAAQKTDHEKRKRYLLNLNAEALNDEWDPILIEFIDSKIS
ncbi:MAG: hypothetical protein WD055_05120 [Candidatus Dependentiae bacterium]